MSEQCRKCGATFHEQGPCDCVRNEACCRCGRERPAPPEPRWVPCQRADLKPGDVVREIVEGVWIPTDGRGWFDPDFTEATYERWTP